MSRIEQSIEVDVPVRTAYDQWTQFESFPEFMQGVEEVRQLTDTTLHWKTEIGLAKREFDAKITDQVPDQVVAWEAIGEARHTGRVRFDKLDEGRTRVHVAMQWDPQGFVEKGGDSLNIVDTRVEGDMKRFKDFIESQGRETGAWRGEVHGGQETPPSTY